MPDRPTIVAMLGGIPESLGGGGLEVQVARTAEALARRGVEVFQVAQEPRARPFDVLHVFGSEPDVCHVVTHWRRNPSPLVVSPVIVAAAGLQRLHLRHGGRIPAASFAPRMRRRLLHRADAVVALNADEASLVSDLAPGTTCEVIPNGARDLGPPGALPLPDPFGDTPFVVLIGSVSARKRQAATVRALAGTGFRPVVVGPFHGRSAERAEFESAVVLAGGVWLGETSDVGTLARLLDEAVALVHLSTAEGQSLVVLEALRRGTPVVVRPLPSMKELAAAWPRHVLLCKDDSRLADVLSSLDAPRFPVDVPTWDQVAARLESLYTRVLAQAGRGTAGSRPS